MTESNIILRLKEILPDVPDPDLALLAEICRLKSFHDKEVILKSGNRKRQVFLILEGAARGFLVNAEGKKGLFCCVARAFSLAMLMAFFE